MMLDHVEYRAIQGSEDQSFKRSDDADKIFTLGWRYEVLVLKAGDIATRPFRFSHRERALGFAESLRDTLRLSEEGTSFEVHVSEWERKNVLSYTGITRDHQYAAERRSQAHAGKELGKIITDLKDSTDAISKG